MTDIYKKLFKKHLKNNLKQVQIDLGSNDKKLVYKIKNTAEKYGLKKEYVYEKIKVGDPITLAFFCKDPSKQNFYEKIAMEYIKKIDIINSFEKLSGYALVGGKPNNDPKAKTQSKSKTLDFFFKYKHLKIYCSHKYTKDKGGAQDNQYNDLKNFIIEARDSNEKDTYFIAIADGNYYDTVDGKSDKIKMDTLRSLCTGIVKACKITELKEILKTLK